MIRRLILVAATAVTICIFTPDASYGAGRTAAGDSINAGYAAAGDLHCTLEIRASEYLVNAGNKVRLSIAAATDTKYFKAGEGVHKRTARYDFIGVFDKKICVDDEEYRGSSCTVILGADGKYRISASGRFVWETDMGKVSEGFKRYYSMTVSADPVVVTAADIEKIIRRGRDPGEKEDDHEVKINGKVLHTDEWNDNRIAYNEKCTAGKRRGEDVFWSGEKFILEADCRAEDRPRRVEAVIAGTDYRTELKLEDGKWQGSLFDSSMVGRWGGKQRERLRFRFTAYWGEERVTDDVEVYVDDTEGYWKMHRKE